MIFFPICKATCYNISNLICKTLPPFHVAVYQQNVGERKARADNLLPPGERSASLPVKLKKSKKVKKVKKSKKLKK